MAETLLHTKFHVPALRPNLVLRPQLIERLNLGLYRKLTLVSAPAGSGKTTLIIEWVAGCERPFAWLSLDEGDNDPTRFLAYLIAAIQTVVPTLGTGTLAVLQSPRPPTMDAVLPVLINEIATARDKFVLVLDDYHLIDDKVAYDILTFLLEHLPSQVHLVIATREDPPLPLARLRARDQLTELRVADLRFSQTEAASFLNQVMGLDLTARDISILESRTEGWIAGLQLAALSIRGRENVSGFIDTFAGENRYVVDYLIEEVLQRQPERVRRFLQQTSILDRLCGPLCDAVTGQEEGKALLEGLERENLFVVPIDDRRHWYRYHQLFADVLHARLVDTQPDQIAALHRRASEWFERDGQFSDAVHHALAAEDFDRAADLLETTWRAMNRSYQSATLMGWMKALPEDVVRTRPRLCIGYAWASLSCGELEASENRLQDAEKWLRSSEAADEQPATTLPVYDERYHSLAASIANARAYHAQALGDRSGTLKYAQRALDLLPEDDHFERGVTGTLLGLTHWANGELEKGARTFADGLTDIRKAGNNLAAISGSFVLAGIRVAEGRLRDAVAVYEQALQLATEPGAPILRGTADLYVGLSELLREQGDLEAATRGVLKSKELGEQATLPPMQYRSPAVVMARIKQSQGDLDGALDLLHEAERLYIRGPVPDVRPVTALKARVWIAQGRLTSARDWARKQGLSVQNDLNYLREFEHVTLARLLIAEYKKGAEDRAIREALILLERLQKAAEEGKRMGSLIEILMLQALANETRDHRSSALACLERALVLAEPQGYVRSLSFAWNLANPTCLQPARELAQDVYWRAFTDVQKGRTVMNSTAHVQRETNLTVRNTSISLNRAARIAGVLYLAIILSGIFAEFFVRSSLIVPGDSAATASNVLASQGLFRLGIAGDLIMILCDVALALLFYVLLKPVSNALALLAAFFRLAQATTLGVNLLNLFLGLQLLIGAQNLDGGSTDQAHYLALLFFNAHGTGYSIALVFFGVSLVVLGYLVFNSGYLPRVLGILLIAAAAGYLIDSFASFLLPSYDEYETIFTLVVFAPALIAELSLCLWLLVKGVAPRQGENDGYMTRSRAEATAT